MHTAVQVIPEADIADFPEINVELEACAEDTVVTINCLTWAVI